MKYHNFCTCNVTVIYVLLSIINYRRNPLDIFIEKKQIKKSIMLMLLLII